MYSYQYGGKQGTTYHAELADELLVVRTRGNKSVQEAVTSSTCKQLLSQLQPIVQYAHADVTVFQCKAAKNQLLALRDKTRQALKSEKDIRFAGRVLREDRSAAPVVYTENLFVKFHDKITEEQCKAVLADKNLTVKAALSFADNAWFVAAMEGTGLDIFQIAQDILAKEEVELCHPELIKPGSQKAAAPEQWHLAATQIDGANVDAHVNVQDAWQITKGENITIAVIDDGVDVDHEEFSTPGKVVAPYDATLNIEDASPKLRRDNHGTACAGVACGDGNHGASGVAPASKLMPIRLASGLGSIREAMAFVWAVQNGADVISNSWGVPDGRWYDPADPNHFNDVGQPDHTRLAINYALTRGRNGKGCVITWAAGNGNENVEFDGYAANDNVICVAACNDTNTRSVYSDFGQSIWCTFPSNDFGRAAFGHPPPKTEGIWTTDRSGRSGYNQGELNPFAEPPGDDHGHYTETFGGTSSACPGVAGIAALILSVNPDLTWQQVREIIRESCEQIDLANGNYDSDGHSPFYGYGRPDAGRAVQLAREQ